MSAAALFPPLEPFRTHRLAVGDGHELKVEECGRADGEPVLFLHGGPGSGCAPWHRQFFDPERYRAVLPDQRGAGASTPSGGLVANTTAHLIADLECIRAQLGIERWLLFGGSWGSTLALAYAQAHPQRVTGMVLRGVFTATPEEFHWLLGGPAGWIHPEAWQAFREAIPADERHDLAAAYYRPLCSEDRHEREAAARAWDRWEGSIATLRPDADAAWPGDIDAIVRRARIECHYFVHACFLESPAQLLEALPRLQHLPCVIVQGRYDVICPMRAAWRLHRAWPGSELVIVPDAGHSAAEPGAAAAMVDALARFDADSGRFRPRVEPDTAGEG